MPGIYFSILILMIALAGAALFTWPKYQELNFLNENVKVKEVELRSKTEYFDDIKRISEELKAYEESLAKISSALPADPFLPATFNFLQNAASQAGLILGEVAVGSITTLDDKPVIGAEAAGPRAVRAMHLSIALAGSYEALKSFLAEVEQSARIIEIKDISFAEPEVKKPLIRQTSLF